MFNALLITALFVIIGAIQITPLVKGKKNRELIVYIIVLSLAYFFSIIQVFGIRLKKPNDFLTWINKIF